MIWSRVWTVGSGCKPSCFKCQTSLPRIPPPCLIGHSTPSLFLPKVSLRRVHQRLLSFKTRSVLALVPQSSQHSSPILLDICVGWDHKSAQSALQSTINFHTSVHDTMSSSLRFSYHETVEHPVPTFDIDDDVDCGTNLETLSITYQELEILRNHNRD